MIRTIDTFKERLKELREEAGLTQYELAKKIGATQKAISFWELGLNEPKASYIFELAKTFKVTSDYLLGLED